MMLPALSLYHQQELLRMGDEFQLQNNILHLKTKSRYDFQYKEQTNCHHIPDDDDNDGGGGDYYQTKSHHFYNFLQV